MKRLSYNPISFDFFRIKYLVWSSKLSSRTPFSEQCFQLRIWLTLTVLCILVHAKTGTPQHQGFREEILVKVNTSFCVYHRNNSGLIYPFGPLLSCVNWTSITNWFEMLVRYLLTSIAPLSLVGCLLNCTEHWEIRSYRSRDGAIPLTNKERQDPVSSYYTQSTVHVAAAKKEVHLTPEGFLYMAKNPNNSNILWSAQYMHREPSVRMAHGIMGFRKLPFIVGCHPVILSVNDMYLDAF